MRVRFYSDLGVDESTGTGFYRDHNPVGTRISFNRFGVILWRR